MLTPLKTYVNGNGNYIIFTALTLMFLQGDAGAAGKSIEFKVNTGCSNSSSGIRVHLLRFEQFVFPLL